MHKQMAAPKRRVPPIGMRMIKSAVAVFLCFLVHIIRSAFGYAEVYQSIISTLFCIQDHVSNTKTAAFNRIIGTLIGAAFGALAVLLQYYVFAPQVYDGIVGYTFIALMIIPIIYTTVLLRLTTISYFACVVFLSVAMTEISDNPMLMVANRMLDTFVGVFVGMIVNIWQLPRRYQNDILFLAGLDDTLLDMRESLSPYSKVELNKMISEGAKFSLTTRRTPASLVEVAYEIELKYPVIAMDGAVLYDITTNEYLKVYVISQDTVCKIADFFEREEMNYFANVMMGDTIVIYCQEELTKIEYQMYRRERKSPYRHYIKGPVPRGQDAIYFMVIAKRERIMELVDKLKDEPFYETVRIKIREAREFPGCYYLRIYNKNATKRNMIDYLKNYIGVKSVVTFDSEEDEFDYDDVIQSSDTNEVVRTMKKLYKPIGIDFKKKNHHS